MSAINYRENLKLVVSFRLRDYFADLSVSWVSVATCGHSRARCFSDVQALKVTLGHVATNWLLDAS